MKKSCDFNLYWPTECILSNCTYGDSMPPEKPVVIHTEMASEAVWS